MKNLVLNLRNAKAQAGCAESKHTSLSFRKGLGVGLTCLFLTLGVGQMWATDYILGPDGSWTQNAAHTLGSSGISNWVYKDLTVSGQWTNFKVLNGSSWYGKDSGGNNVTPGTVYTPTTSGDNMYCDFKASSLTYYFFFNTSTKKLMIQPKYYLAGTCGASDQNWSTTANAPTYDATNGYFKWNTSSLTAGADNKFKLVTYNSWSYYNYQNGTGTITVEQGTKQATDGDNNIIFQSTYAGTAIITLNPTTNAMVVHCPYQVSYNKGANGTGTNTTASKTWKTSLTLAGATFSRAGYTQDGWSTVDGGAKVYNLSGSYTTDADVTLYPHWVENMSSVSLVASPTGKGSFTIGGAAATSTSAGVTTTRSVTAVPISGYHFVSWSITGGASISSTTTNPTTITGGGAGTAATLTATFAADDVYSLTVAAGTGISAVTGSTNDIKAAQNIPITATVATGYTWNTWTKTGAGTLSTFTAGTKNQTVTVGTAGDITLTASATENMSTLTTSNHYDAGNPSYAIPTKSVSSIGIATTSNLTATAAGTGYTFAGWTLSSNLVVTSGNAATDLSITVRTNGNGAAATAQANYEEDLSTSYVIKGGTAITGGTAWSTEIAFTKKSGESTGSIAYAEIPISTTITDGTKANYEFKIVNGSTWYGLDGAGNVWDYYSNSGEQTLVTGDNIRLNANVVGTYIAKIDYSTPASPKITITWPVALSIYRSDPTDDTNIGDHAWNSMPTSSSYRWTLNLEANTTYEFKINEKGTYYGSNTDITTTVSNRAFSTGTSDTKLITKSAGTFTFTWDALTHKLTLQYPKSTAMGASPISVYSGGTTTLTAYGSELGSGTKSITYDFYKGTTLTDANKVGTVTHSSVSGTDDNATQNVTVNFDGNNTSQVYTIRMTIGGNSWTNTVTVYRKWDIYVHDVASWGGMYNHMWGNGETTWPGNTCSLYNGSTTWYTVTIDAKYPHFQLNCNNCTNTMRTYGGDDAYTPNITTFTPGSYWYTKFHDHGGDGHDYYTLESITLSDPTVTLSASVANCKNITLTGTVTDCGGDGSFASDMKEVYFQVAGTKNDATTVSTTSGAFTKTLSNATAGATNTLQAFATNIHGTGSSSVLHYTNVTLNRQGGTTGTTAVTAVENMAMPAGATAPGKTGYIFGGYYASAGGSGKQYYNASMGSANNWDLTSQAATIHAKWTAITYTIHFNGNGNTSGSMSDQTGVTYDSGTTLTANAFVKTGYNFAGWATTKERADAGTVDRTDGAAHGNLTSTQGATAQLWAVWTPKQSAISFDYQLSTEGHGNAGTLSSVTATYDAAMPALTGNMPTAAEGYAFMGFFSETGGNGTKYYNADKSSAHNWDIDTESGTTLYAYYKKAEITEITLDADMKEPMPSADPDESKNYVIANPTIEPSPEGTNIVCWEFLYDNDNPLPAGHEPSAYTEGGTKPNQVRFSIVGLAAGTYKIRATLRTGSSCAGGTEISTLDKKFVISNAYTVTILYQDEADHTNIAASTTSPGKATECISISAPDIFGYTFNGWQLGDGITSEDPTSKQTDFCFKATFDGTIIAEYTKKEYIYLDLSQEFSSSGKWSTPYVYFYNGDPWVNGKGAGATGHTHYISGSGHAMTQIEGTDIWYFDYSGVDGAGNYIAFTKTNQTTYEHFYATDVIFRGDFSEGTPLFVPATDQTKETVNSSSYYNKGYWVKYLGPQTGYTMLVYNSAGDVVLKRERFESAEKRVPMHVSIDIDPGTYQIEVYRNDGHWYKQHAGSTFNSSNQGPIALDGSSKGNLVANASGTYIFTLGYSSGNLQLSVAYPATVGDFRLCYTDNATWSQAHTINTWKRPSHPIIHRANGVDTVSFFISKGDGITAKIRWEKATAVSSSNVTWGTTGSWTTTGLTDVETAGVYNFKVTQNENGTAISSIERIGEYEGGYYIRCNALNSKWDHYTTDGDHRMTYSSFSESAANSFGEKYSHYKTKWCPRNTNIKFCIANDYSPCITDTLTQDLDIEFNNTESDGTLKYEKDGSGNMKYDDASAYLDIYSANVRFMWNRSTNKICRRYVAAATSNEARFLVLQGSGTANSNIYNGSTGAAFTANPPGANSVILQDDQNWIYEVIIQANPSALAKLYANYNGVTQWFRGAEGTPFVNGVNAIELLGGDPVSSKYSVRVIYDFKTNRLVCAWMPTGASQEIGSDLDVDADVMVIREHQEPAQCITFANDAKMTDVKTVYGAMKFNRWILGNRAHPEDVDPTHCRESDLGNDLQKYHPVLPVGEQKSIYERSLYFISFPFDVRVSEIFGFGRYWDEWYLEYYDGLTRAKNGYWMDSPPNWKYIDEEMAKDYVLKANEGYILGLDLDFMQADNVKFWSNGISTVELYFPSTVDIETLQSTNCTIPALNEIAGDPYRCTINRGTTEGDRRVKDSYWRCIGVPSFNIYNSALKDSKGNSITWHTSYTWQEDDSEFPFIYMWNKGDNTLTAQSTSNFRFDPMHAYLAQIGSKIIWTAVSAQPSSIVARQAAEETPTEYNWRITLEQNDEMIDQTYVRMTNIEQVTDTFDFGQDLAKELNYGRSDIYTLIGYERAAANSKPIETKNTTIIPLGLNIEKSGDYTFAIPEGTNGVGVTLVDEGTGIRTSLGALTYTVSLEKGDYNERFYLEISPIHSTPTGVGNVPGDDAQNTKVRKVIIDQNMYIIRDGKMYDARGARVE